MSYAPLETRNYVAKIAPFYEASEEMPADPKNQNSKLGPGFAVLVVSGLILWGIS